MIQLQKDAADRWEWNIAANGLYSASLAYNNLAHPDAADNENRNEKRAFTKIMEKLCP